MIRLEIIRGKIQTAQKVVVYGPEGIGKSTFASQFPNPLFIDTEGSTKHMEVARFPRPESWAMLTEQVHYVKDNPTVCKTLVIDTVDWAEQLCVAAVCTRHQKKGIEDFGYGNGYVYAKEEFLKFLHSLDSVIEAGIHVVLTAHAQIRKFEQPDEMGAYDRWELKLGKKTSSQTAPLVKEWADMVLFANYKTISVAVDEKGKKHKAQGGKRVMYTEHHPCWDAKNRHGLPCELPFSFDGIRHIFASGNPEPVKQDVPKEEKIDWEALEAAEDLSDLPKDLAELMKEHDVTKKDIQIAVAQKGYYPPDTEITAYDPQFISGVLVGAWEQVYQLIQDEKSIPF